MRVDDRPEALPHCDSDPVDRALAVVAIPFYLWLLAAALALVLAGCAFAVPPLPGGQQAAPVCLPDGFPSMDTWEAVRLEPRVVATDRAGAVIVMHGTYLISGHRMEVVLTPFGPASIDPAPDDATVPPWINPALTRDDLSVRAAPDPDAPCRWRLMAPALERAPRPQDAEGTV